MNTQIILAMKAIILHGKKALIVQRSYQDTIGAGTWEFVGGKLEFGEDLETGLKREITEEVGIDVTVGKLLYASTFQTQPTRQVVILTYLCHCENDLVVLSDEHEDYKWAGKETIRNFIAEGILQDLDKFKILEKLDIMLD